MKIQSKIQKSVEMILWAAVLGAAASAQRGGTPGRGGSSAGGNLKNDIVETVPIGEFGQYTGPIFDAGSIFVDLALEDELEVTIEVWPVGSGPHGVRPPQEEQKKVRLAGGAPGNAGVILINPNAPGDKSKHLRTGSVAISGVFAADGSILVDLPELESDVYVQGVEVTHLGNHLSDIFRVKPPGEIAPPEFSWEANQILDAALRATKDLGPGDKVTVRLFGAARVGGVDGYADVTVTLGRERRGFSLYLGQDLVERTGVVDLDGEAGATFHFRRAEDLAEALEAVVLLDAFAGLDFELEAARLNLAALRNKPGVFGRCGTPDAPSGGGHGQQASTPTESREREVTLTNTGETPEFGDESPLAGDPGRASGKQTKPAHKNRGRFNGTIRDGGSVTVEDEEGLVAGWEVVEILGSPRRAGKPTPEIKPVGGKPYGGPVGDAGSRTIDLRSKARRTMEDLQSASRTLDLLRQKLARHML